MAGGEVVGELAGIASGGEDEPDKWREAWNKAMLRIMRNCGREFVGELGMTDGPTAYRAFCHSLIPLHSDKLERRLSPPDPDLEEVTKGLLSKDAKSDLESRRRPASTRCCTVRLTTSRHHRPEACTAFRP